MNIRVGRTQEDKGQTISKSSPKRQSWNKATLEIADNRPESIVQRKLQKTIDNSLRTKQLKAFQERINEDRLSVSNVPTNTHVLQRAVNVSVEQRKGSVVIFDSGFVSEYEKGNDAQNIGWNGVEKYKAEVKVGDSPSLKFSETSNNYLAAEAGHVLAKQNGGRGSDPNNVFAQDGGVNNGPFRISFENPMRKLLNEANEDDDVEFRAVLYGENITQGLLKKRGEDLEASEEDTDFEGFD